VTADAKQLAGSQCGTIYERELQAEFQDRLFFYCDGKIRFERACYGEAAGLVFEVWASGFDDEGNICWIDKPKYDSYLAALPDRLTDIQEEGNALQFDEQFRRFMKVDSFKLDPERGYTKWKMLFMKKNK
jgi:hypothetical protein